MGNPSQSESLLRNGHPQSRPQPPPIQHSPFSFPPQGGGGPQSATPNQQSMGAILSPQPRAPANMQSMQSAQNPSTEWTQMERPPPMQDPHRPSSRPNSFVSSAMPASRTSSESPRPYAPNMNGHPHPQQR